MRVLSGEVQAFLERYKNFLDDMRKILVLGRTKLRKSAYTQLLLTLHSCDIYLPAPYIFATDIDKYVITWQDNDALIEHFDNNLSQNDLILNTTIQDLNNISAKDFIEYLDNTLDIRINPGFSYFLSDNKLKKSNNKLNPEIECKAFVNIINDDLRVLINISDIEGNTIGLQSNVKFGQYLPEVGYGWNSKRFSYISDLLIKIVQGSVTI